MATDNKDTYKATAVFLVVMGLLYLIDRTFGFGRMGAEKRHELRKN